MAIIFTKALPTDKPLMAFNNNIVRFHSDNVLTPLNCEMSIDGEVFILYPNPQGQFYYNFKELIATFMNADKFRDDLDVSVDPLVNYDWTDKVYLKKEIEFKIIFDDESFETASVTPRWLSAYVQLTEFRNTAPNNQSLFVMTPFLKFEAKTAYLKYWIGYPFDFTYYCPDEELTAYIFNVNRQVCSDGFHAIGYTIGLHNFTVSSGTEGSTPFTISLNTVNPDCRAKHYLKWINRFGGWNYWLFNRGKINLATKGLGELNNDFENVEDTLSQTENIGVTSGETISVNDDFDKQELLLLRDLFESPKVYLFTGNPGEVNNYTDWIEVNIKDKTTTIQSVKHDFVNIALDIELPKRITRTL